MSKAAWTIVAVAVVTLVGLAVYMSLYMVPKQVIPTAQTQFDYYGSNDWWSPRHHGDERRRQQRHQRQKL